MEHQKFFRLVDLGHFKLTVMGERSLLCMGKILAHLRCEFFEGVTYGESGVEYEANCTHASHTILYCITAPGIGVELYWRVSVEGQTNVLDSNAVSSYAAPWVIDFPTAVDTDLPPESPQRLVGTNLGFLINLQKLFYCNFITTRRKL